MASAPSDRTPVLGRVDAEGRLVAADPELLALQLEAGSQLGAELALPQLAAIARLARRLGVAVARPAVAASNDRDLSLWVRATPEGEEIALSIERWESAPAAGPRLAALAPVEVRFGLVEPALEWVADADLRLVSLSPAVAELLGMNAADVVGQPLTKLFKLEETDGGDMPLLAALAARSDFSGQPATTRGAKPVAILLAGESVTGSDGKFAGFRGSIQSNDSDSAPAVATVSAASVVDQVLDEALRSPLDRIIESADRIAQRSDGPLRSDYAAYASDISAAARHLLSVIRSMGGEPIGANESVDLSALASDAAGLVEAIAEARSVRIEISPTPPLHAQGEARGIIQILVNLIGNAVRHSPERDMVRIDLEQQGRTILAHVRDRGPGIDPADQQRIFERFERAGTGEGGTGLGLAISRRLARSMGGDITVDSAPGRGACFTLSLPAA